MAARSRREGQGPIEHGGAYRIDFDMMLKGSTVKRGKHTIRQFGVTVNGSTRLVTSGDIVDRETYEALLAVGAIRPGTDIPAAGAPDREAGDAST